MEGEQVKTAPPEKSAIKTLTDGIKRQVPFAIEHSISDDQIIMQYLSLKNLLEQMTESERREVEPLVEGMILAWHERRENEMYDKMLASLERRYPGMPGMMLASYESLNHVSRESARPQSEEDGDIKLSTEDMRTLVKCFKGNEKNAISFLEEVKKIGENRKITAIVNKLVEDGKINKSYRGRLLWTILDKYGLYTCTEANWNMRIK